MSCGESEQGMQSWGLVLVHIRDDEVKGTIEERKEWSRS